MTISVYVSDDLKKEITDYASARGLTVSEAMRLAILERMEDEYDIALAKKGLAKWEKDGRKTYTHEEVGKELGFL
ncbi:MAG: DUF6290 family protein [Methanomassiliicoccaceae archaeon]|nr:DUF6290 family protein [Methanomassiliicoccaceae archaeon]